MNSTNLFEARPVAGRRTRPAKKPLSRERIVQTAYRLLNKEGLEGVTLRKVAALLDTGPSSLYVYVENLEALRALVLDRALSEIVLPPEKGSWRSRLDALLVSYSEVLSRCPGLGQLAMSTIAIGPSALRLYDCLLALLEEAGLPPRSRAWAMDLLCLYVTAAAAERSYQQRRKNALVPVHEMLSGLNPEAYPRIYAVRKQLQAEGRFSWAIDVMLEGVLHVR